MAKRTLSNKLRIEILENILILLVKPKITTADNDFKKAIREAIVTDPLNITINEIYSRYKTLYPRAFNSESYISIYVYADEKSRANNSYSDPVTPSAMFKELFRNSVFFHKNSLIAEYSAWDAGRVLMDPPIVSGYDTSMYLTKRENGKHIAPVVHKLMKQYKAEMVELADFVKGVKSILDTCKTVQQFEEGYPELKEYIPVEEQTIHPMVPVVEVKAVLKTLKKLQSK